MNDNLSFFEVKSIFSIFSVQDLGTILLCIITLILGSFQATIFFIRYVHHTGSQILTCYINGN